MNKDFGELPFDPFTDIGIAKYSESDDMEYGAV